MIGAPFITIDALDGVGKTTLVRGLPTQLGGVHLATPGAAFGTLREPVLAALGDHQGARCLFYAATVLARGAEARQLADSGTPVAMDRYWPSTVAYARARSVGMRLDELGAAVPSPDVAILLTLDEATRLRRLHGRGLVTAADVETLDPTFKQTVMRELRALTTLEVCVDGADPDQAVARVRAAITTHLRERAS